MQCTRPITLRYYVSVFGPLLGRSAIDAIRMAQMSNGRVKISGARSFLAHTPGLVRYGSKPAREIQTSNTAESEILAGLRGYQEAAAYLPNVAYLGGFPPDSMWDVERPWYGQNGE